MTTRNNPSDSNCTNLTEISYDTEIPDRLVNEIVSGNCVIFIGSGFTQPAGFLGWKSLLLKISEKAHQDEKIDKNLVETIKKLLVNHKPTAHEMDSAAQLLQDELSQFEENGDAFQYEMVKYLKACLFPKELPLSKVMERRLELLRQIPFKGILTTNYNPLLKGVTPFDKEKSRKAYRDVLRTRNFDEDIVKVLDLNDEITNFDYGVAVSKNDKMVYKSVPNPVIQLHGNLSKSESVVLTSQSYRRLLYEIPGYLMFLKSLLASKTVLFVGFSFTDAYLNEIRSEVMALLGSEEKEPVAYAITPNKSKLVCDYNLRHFGTKFMNYDTSGPLGYEAFDPIFEALAEKVDKAVKYN